MVVSRVVPTRSASCSWVSRTTAGAVVQGAAAILFKTWTATVRAGLPALQGQVVLCLHDELLLHVPQHRAPDAAALLTEVPQATRCS